MILLSVWVFFLVVLFIIIICLNFIFFFFNLFKSIFLYFLFIISLFLSVNVDFLGLMIVWLLRRESVSEMSGVVVCCVILSVLRWDVWFKILLCFDFFGCWWFGVFLWLLFILVFVFVLFGGVRDFEGGLIFFGNVCLNIIFVVFVSKVFFWFVVLFIFLVGFVIFDVVSDVMLIKLRGLDVLKYVRRLLWRGRKGGEGEE